MKQIRWSSALKYLVLLVLNILVIIIAIKIPRELHAEYMLSFVPVYALFYGAFSRLLTKSTLLPTIILFIPFWCVLGGISWLVGIFDGINLWKLRILVSDFLLICAISGIYCVFSIIPSLFIKLIAWLIGKFARKTHKNKDKTGDG